MRLFILSNFKIQELESPHPLGTHLSEDLIDTLKNTETYVLEDESIVISKFKSNPNLRYFYELEIKKRVVE